MNSEPMPDLAQLCHQVSEIARDVGQFIREEGKTFDRSSIERKDHKELVSYVDRTAEQKLIAQIESLLPAAGYIAEEGTSDKRGERWNWIIDPLDGTTNFMHGLAPHAVSIALADGNIPVLGVVYEIIADECFYAWQGGGAWLNGERIAVSRTTEMEDSLIAIGFPYAALEQLPQFLDMAYQLQRNAHGVRRLGSAATDMAYVACGRYEGFVEMGLSPWDVAGGSIIVHEAGGLVSDFVGGQDFLYGKRIVATNQLIHSELRTFIAKHLA